MFPVLIWKEKEDYSVIEITSNWPGDRLHMASKEKNHGHPEDEVGAWSRRSAARDLSHPFRWVLKLACVSMMLLLLVLVTRMGESQDVSR
jgi:hypothetical protein